MKRGRSWEPQTAADLVNAAFDSHHDGVTKHFPIFGQSFPGLELGLVLQVHPVTRGGHLPAMSAVNPTVTFAPVRVFYCKISGRRCVCILLCVWGCCRTEQTAAGCRTLQLEEIWSKRRKYVKGEKKVIKHHCGKTWNYPNTVTHVWSSWSSEDSDSPWL